MNMNTAYRRWLGYGWLTLCFTLLSACGFHLREASPLPFKSVYVAGKRIAITEPLKQELIAKGTSLANTGNEAEVMLELITEQNTKRILSLNGAGVVREYELYYRVTYRTKIAGEATWSLPLIMESRRDYTFNDAVLLSKQGEEKSLQENMQSEVISGILRRLSALKKAS